MKQTKLRADRLGALSPELYVLCETNMERVEEAVDQIQPHFLVIDSIQTVYLPEVTSAPGSVAQVRECVQFMHGLLKAEALQRFL